MKLSDLVNKRRNLAIDMDGDTLNIVYRPHYMTGAVESEINSIQDSKQRVLAMFDLLCKVVVSWDLSDDSGIALPLQPQALVDAGLTADVASYVISKVADESNGVGEANAAS